MAMLPPEILASAADVTLPNLVEAQDRLEAEARAVMPYSFDECTYARGAIRQSVWSCLDCGQKGVCYGCSISCHSEHRLVELWTKRGFTCDCPTEGGACGGSASAGPSSSASRARSTCTLTRGDVQPRNTANKYSHNFAGDFCRCGRDYDPETETEAMIHCIACEDWFHESCLNLAARQPPREPTDDDDGDNSDDDETRSLIPSDSYDGLVCGACAEHPFVAARKGTPGWMVVVWGDEGWYVRGREAASPAPKVPDTGAATAGVSDPSATGTAQNHPSPTRASAPASQPPTDPDTSERTEAVPARPAKRPSVDDGPDAKRVRVDAGDARGEDDGEDGDMEVLATTDEPAADRPGLIAGTGAGDVFLAHGVRERLRETLDAATAASLPFPLVDEEIYEPPADTDEPESLDDLTQRVVGSLPRVQAIEALHGYQAMKDKLKVMLAGHVASGEAVSRADIEAFFDDLRGDGARS